MEIFMEEKTQDQIDSEKRARWEAIRNSRVKDTIIPETSYCYNNNIQLKKSGVNIPFTKEQIEEYIKCKNDIIYFLKTYCEIVTLDYGLAPFELYKYQEDIINSCKDNNQNIFLLGRQQGKTTTIAGYILHEACFKTNNRTAILANKSDSAKEVLERVKEMFELLPWFLKPGVKSWNKQSIELSNGNKIFSAATSSSSIRGKSINCISGDSIINIKDGKNVHNIKIETLYNIQENIKKCDNDSLGFKMNNNKYSKWYFNIIKNAKNREKTKDIIFEKHHILPKSLGGSNLIENLVFLTLREHFICHKLLIRMYTGKAKAKMVYAAFMMSNVRKNIKISSKEYENLKSTWLDIHKNREISQEYRDKISLAQKKHWDKNRESILKKRIDSGFYVNLGIKVKEYIKNNPEKHYEKMMKINLNPEKIKKMADKHRGMIR